jgi:hypothetical protein
MTFVLDDPPECSCVGTDRVRYYREDGFGTYCCGTQLIEDDLAFRDPDCDGSTQQLTPPQPWKRN